METNEVLRPETAPAKARDVVSAGKPPAEARDAVRTETTAAQKNCRRVGTFTFGMVMVLAGLAMLVSMFYPAVNMGFALKLTPLALVSLGIEVLLAARGNGRVKYDWVGMLLCVLIVCTALTLFAVAWCVVNEPGWVHYF